MIGTKTFDPANPLQVIDGSVQALTGITDLILIKPGAELVIIGEPIATSA